MSQFSSYFSEVDNAVQMGDTNRRNQPTTNTCYGPPVPVQANSYTTLIISSTADNTADLYNGYIHAVMNVKIKSNTTFSAIEESFVTSCESPESVQRADVFSKVRHKDVFNKNTNYSCGEYINWSGTTSGNTIEIDVKLNIDLRRFLPLSNINFAGKIELRVYFSTAGLVCCPINP